MVMMEEEDYFGMDSLGFQADPFSNSSSISNSLISHDNPGSAASAAVATANILLLKKKILSLQSVHEDHEERCAENAALKAELEKTRKQMLAQSRTCSLLKKQVQLAVGGGTLKAMQDLKKELVQKTTEREEAQNSLAGTHALLAQMKCALEEAETKRDEVLTTLELNEALISQLKAKNELFEKRFQMIMDDKVNQVSERKEKLIVSKKLRAMERKFETCKIERDLVTEELARSNSSLCFCREQLQKARDEKEFMRMTVEEMRKMVGGSTNLPLLSEACRSPVSAETSPNLVPPDIAPRSSSFQCLDAEQDDPSACASSVPLTTRAMPQPSTCIPSPPLPSRKSKLRGSSAACVVAAASTVAAAAGG
eukprot:scpid91408/ scgid21786/ 